jgi:TetR/AcrR family tetracycline transcriptional repressor
MALSQNEVVAGALALLDEVGLDGLSMRALATRLNVQAPTLYWHVSSKQALLDTLANALLAPAVAKIDKAAAPSDVLRSVAYGLRYALLERRDGARVFAGTYVIGENVFALAEIALDALLKSGLDESQAVDAMFNLIHYVTGFAIEEQALSDRWVEPKELSNARQAFVEFAEGRYPAISRCASAILSPNFDRRFADGLEALLSSTDTKMRPRRARPS